MIPVQLSSTEGTVLKQMREHFGNKTFMKHEARVFEQFSICNSYSKEEESFMKNLKLKSKDKLPKGADNINRNPLYKVKQEEDETLKLKSRIDPHGNQDIMRLDSNTYCATCPPTDLRIMESIASLNKWTVHKADVTAAFLQTGLAKIDVYVRSPLEIRYKVDYIWLLMTAAYGLANSNPKWKNQSDHVLLDYGMEI